MTKHQYPRLPVRIRFVLRLCCAILLFGVLLFSQVNTGRILGTVTDQTGGVIAGATVTVTNTGTGVARNLTTNQSGAYAAPNLIPGTYSVRVVAMGFRTFLRQNITVGVGQAARVDAQLTPGQVNQTIEINAAAPMINTTNAVVSGTLSAQTITNLPLNGRNFENLLPLHPGFVAVPGGGTLTSSTNGLQPQDNNYVYEGLDGIEPFSGQSITNTTLPFGDAATLLPVDAIQELNIETNPPAEFGRHPGAVINIGIKSGTNAIHGTAFAFGRDGSWDARDFINPPNTTPPEPLEFEQWGATVGGPILKNKLFYFGAFERQTYNVGTAFTEKIPTTNSAADSTIGIPAAEAALAAASIAVSPLSTTLLPQYGTNTGTTQNVSRGFGNNIDINNGVGKLDYHLNDHHAFSGSFYRGEGSALGEDGVRTQPYFSQLGTMISNFLTTSWTWTPNSSWVNDLRFGWNHYQRETNVADYQTPPTTYGINTGITDPKYFGMPVITVSGFTQLGGDANSPKTFGPLSDYDVVDHVSFLHGNHNFQFGGEILTWRGFYSQARTGRGEIQFKGGQTVNGLTLQPLEAFLAGIPTLASLQEGSPDSTFTQWDYSAFFQDTWRVRPRLTVNLGLRYEYYTPLSEINNHVASWSPTVGLQQQGVNISSPYNADSKDFSPRVGIAWDITGKGTTVLRAGVGVYYTNIIGLQLIGNNALNGAPGISAIPTAFSLYLANGQVLPPLDATNGIGTTTVKVSGSNLNWTSAGPVFPSSVTSGFVCGDGIAPINPVEGAPAKNPSPCSIMFVSSKLPSPRVYSWNFGIEHALTPNVTFEANYVGNYGSHLPSVRDLNQIDPNSPAEIACGHCESPTDLPYFSAFPYLSYIYETSDSDTSNYNALQATLTARTFHNLSFIAAYTYSHALTNLPGSNFHTSVPQNSLAPQLDYGAAEFDVRHHFTFTFTYNIPGIKSPGQMLEGWSVNSAIALQSGTPWNVVDSRDLSGTGEFQDRWDFFGNPSDFKAGPNPIPFYAGTVTVPDPNNPNNTIAILNPNLPQTCLNAASSIGTATITSSLGNYGCYAAGNSVMIAPAPGQFGTMGRSIFYGPDFYNWDFSLFKNWTFAERLTAQFRAEFFNVLNIPNYANPAYVGTSDPSAGQFGCGCETPDVANTNPVLGTGSAREIQLGLKLIF
jgi:Carboxypeptidase regulatory-like domain/TonB dependent receptor-like, beta-barrel